MPCKKCQAHPEFHSFIKFGKFKEAHLYYTSPVKSLDKNEDGTKLENVLIDVKEETEHKKWIWVLDCEGMGVEHYTELHFNRGIVNLISTDTNLQEIWVIRPNVWIKTTIAFFQLVSWAPIFSRIHYIEGSKFEQSDKLSKFGLDDKTIRWLV